MIELGIWMNENKDKVIVYGETTFERKRYVVITHEIADTEMELIHKAEFKKQYKKVEDWFSTSRSADISFCDSDCANIECSRCKKGTLWQNKKKYQLYSFCDFHKRCCSYKEEDK